MSEAVLLAWASAIKAVAEMITEIVRGQPKELREKAWARWERDIERWEKFWGMDQVVIGQDLATKGKQILEREG